jgi:3-phosphoshikimate 1-carboxyvinyltransferase
VEGKRLVRWTVEGRGKPGRPSLGGPGETVRIDVGNSGTTLFLVLAAAAHAPFPVCFDGDSQIRRRGAGPLLAALESLGVHTESEEGRAPITIRGPWKGGRVSIECPTSQYLSALLIAAPLAPKGVITEIDVPLLNEKPYVEMTLAYLDAQGISCERKGDLSWFRIPGGQGYKPVRGPVPADFSSAAFPALGAAVSGGPVELLGLDSSDTQGDKAFFDVLKTMGCGVRWEEAPGNRPILRVEGGLLRGGEFDLNDTPDTLPACAVTAAFARGDTALINAAHARIKETDRIAVMTTELGKLGVKVTERPDGLIVHGTGKIPGGRRIDGHGDHRVVMAFAAAALGARNPIEIGDAECAAVTYPGFWELLGAELLEAELLETKHLETEHLEAKPSPAT